MFISYYKNYTQNIFTVNNIKLISHAYFIHNDIIILKIENIHLQTYNLLTKY